MRNLLTTILILISFLVFTQHEWSSKIKVSFMHKRYSETISIINKTPVHKLSKYEKWIEAESHRQMHNYEEALQKYEEIDLDAIENDSAYFCFAEVLSSNGQYKRASHYYQLFNKNHPTDILSKTKFEAHKTLDLLPENKDVYIHIFELSTSENDLVGFYKDQELVMASSGLSGSKKVYKWDGQHYLNYYTCQEVGGILNAVEVGSELKTKLHEGPGFYDKTSQTLYFTRNARVHNTIIEDEKVSNLKIYTSTFQNEKWSSVKEVDFNAEHYSTGHPTGIPGQNTLIFSSDKPGGNGEADLYIVNKTGKGWSKPQVLEGIINTSGHELFPFLKNDSTLYFSSNGHGGFGGLDLFKAKIKKGKVSEIENLGTGFNSPHDDFGLIYTDFLGLEGYFSSDRVDGLGGSDIYTFKHTSSLLTILVEDESGHSIRNERGTLTISNLCRDFETDSRGIHETPLMNRDDVQVAMNIYGYQSYENSFSLYGGLDTLKIILIPEESYIQINGVILDESSTESVQGVNVKLDIDSIYYIDTTNQDGEFSFVLPQKSKYDITIYKKGYFTNQISSDTSQGSLEINQPLTPINQGMLLNIESIYYDYDEHYITYQAEPILDSLAKIMLLNPTLEIEINSHADSRGTEWYNEELSLERAKSAIDYLKTRGVKSSRISIRYHGESKLINPCGNGINCDEDSHSLNRRTEFRVVSF